MKQEKPKHLVNFQSHSVNQFASNISERKNQNIIQSNLFLASNEKLVEARSKLIRKKANLMKYIFYMITNHGYFVLEKSNYQFVRTQHQ